MNKKIEVEIRGPLSKEQFEFLNKTFKKQGKFIAGKDRIALCYPDPTTGSLIEKVNTDIRIRTTNGIPEINIKLGKWGGHEHRHEMSLVGKNGDFDKMVMMMAAMGFKKGIVAIRKGKVYKYKNIEFSVVEVPGHSYFFEAEIMVGGKSEVTKAKEKIRTICKNLSLKTFSDESFYDYIHQLNGEANEKFDFKNYKEGYFKRRFGI